LEEIEDSTLHLNKENLTLQGYDRIPRQESRPCRWKEIQKETFKDLRPTFN